MLLLQEWEQWQREAIFLFIAGSDTEGVVSAAQVGLEGRSSHCPLVNGFER